MRWRFTFVTLVSVLAIALGGTAIAAVTSGVRGGGVGSDNRVWSFNAEERNGAVMGRFAVSGLDGKVVVSGPVRCLSVTGNVAFLSGVVTDSFFYPALIGLSWAGVAVDMGSAKAGDPPDLVGDTVGSPALFAPATMCNDTGIQAFLLSQQITLKGDMKLQP